MKKRIKISIKKTLKHWKNIISGEFWIQLIKKNHFLTFVKLTEMDKNYMFKLFLVFLWYFYKQDVWTHLMLEWMWIWLLLWQMLYTHSSLCERNVDVLNRIYLADYIIIYILKLLVLLLNYTISKFLNGLWHCKCIHKLLLPESKLISFLIIFKNL